MIPNSSQFQSPDEQYADMADIRDELLSIGWELYHDDGIDEITLSRLDDHNEFALFVRILRPTFGPLYAEIECVDQVEQETVAVLLTDTVWEALVLLRERTRNTLVVEADLDAVGVRR